MLIMLRWYAKNKNGRANYNEEIKRSFHGRTARECMDEIKDYRLNHDLSKYTATEIINVSD